MNKEVKELLISQSFDDSSLQLNRFIVIYDNGMACNLNKKGAELLMREMYNSGLSREEVFAKIHFLSDEEFDEYYNNLDIVTLRDRSKNKHRLKYTRKESLELDIAKYYNNPMHYSDDIDLGLSINDLKDPNKIYNKMTYLDKLRIRTLTITMSAAIVVCGGYLLLKKSNYNNKLPAVETRKHIENESTSNKNIIINRGKDFYDLLNMTVPGSVQNNFMKSVSLYLTEYNGLFGKEHSSSGVKPALSWDEVIALKLIYNNYSKEDIQRIFSSYKLDANKLKINYNSALNQLEKAYILEENHVLISNDILIDSNDLRDIYNRINRLYIVAKESNGKKQKKNIDEFYDVVYKYLYHSNIQGLDMIIEPLVKSANLLFDGYKKNNRQDYVYGYYTNSIYKTFSDKIFEYASEASDEKSNIGIRYIDFKDSKEKDLNTTKYYRLSRRNIEKSKEYKRVVSRFDDKFPNTKKKSINKTAYQYTKTQKSF